MSKIWKNKKLLIVDDSIVIREKLIKIYKKIGFEQIQLANNGVDAIDKLASYKPDLISLDIIMPEMNGIECYQTLCKEYPDIKFVFISCLSGEKSFINYFKDDISSNMFVSKNVSSIDLENRLFSIFGIHATEEKDDDDDLEDDDSFDDIEDS